MYTDLEAAAWRRLLKQTHNEQIRVNMAVTAATDKPRPRGSLRRQQSLRMGHHHGTRKMPRMMTFTANKTPHSPEQQHRESEGTDADSNEQEATD